MFSHRQYEIFRKFRLPPIEFKYYDGNIKDWLSFWAQFKKVHDDLDIDEYDKIECLIQATVPNSRDRQLVESFPCMRFLFQITLMSERKSWQERECFFDVSFQVI